MLYRYKNYIVLASFFLLKWPNLPSLLEKKGAENTKDDTKVALSLLSGLFTTK